MSRYDIYRKNYVDEIEKLRIKYDIPVKYLHVEVTETSAIGGMELVTGVLKKLHEYGYIVEMDDFGSGYSSLNVLSHFDMDLIKLDMALVQHLEDRKGINKEIIKAMISISRAMGVSTLAEGVETEEQLAFLSAAGCDLVQGFLLRRPVPLETILFIVRGESYVGKWETDEERQKFSPQHLPPRTDS